MLITQYKVDRTSILEKAMKKENLTFQKSHIHSFHQSLNRAVVNQIVYFIHTEGILYKS